MKYSLALFETRSQLKRHWHKLKCPADLIYYGADKTPRKIVKVQKQETIAFITDIEQAKGTDFETLIIFGHHSQIIQAKKLAEINRAYLVYMRV